MEFKTDIHLPLELWSKCEILQDYKIFDRLVDIFIVACTIGIREDKRVKSNFGPNENPKSVARNTISTAVTKSEESIKSILSFLFENAILSTKSVDYSMDDRKMIAFDSENDKFKINPSNFLTEFANYGITLINECITDNDIETISNILSLLDKYINDFGDMDGFSESFLFE